MLNSGSKPLWLAAFVWLLIGSTALAADNAAPSAPPVLAPANDLLPPVAPQLAEAEQNSFLEALTNGTPMLDMRYRYENVQQNNFSHEAAANTVRTRLGYETGEFEDFKARIQVENLMPFGNEDYNDSTNGRTQFPTIGDPRETLALYEANVTWSGVPQSTLTFGREALVLDNERWVGDIDWRQLGQTMDAMTAQNHSIDNLNLSYTYLFHVDRVFGPRAGNLPYESYDTQSHLLNANYTGIPGVKFISYGYLLDLLNAPTLSSQTYGGRVEATREIFDDTKALFNGEYARQFSYGNDPASFGYNYYLVEPGVSVGPFKAKIAYEVMGGDGNNALQAPIGSGHGFNGWAEKFLTTPATGLDSFHICAEYVSPSHNAWLDSTNVKLVWYDFSADNSNLHYGNEYDMWIGQTFYKHYTLGLEYAQYDSDKPSLSIADTRKIAVQLQIKY